MNKFQIATLSDRNSRRSRLADPVTVITGGVALIQSLFPNIFGGGRRRLTENDWIQLFPGTGYWTVALRNYLKSKIHYDADIKNIPIFSRYFVYENKNALGLGTYPNNEQIMPPFYKILETEKYSGGQSPVGNVPGGIAGSVPELPSWVWIAGGGLLLFALSKKKR